MESVRCRANASRARKKAEEVHGLSPQMKSMDCHGLDHGHSHFAVIPGELRRVLGHKYMDAASQEEWVPRSLSV